MTRRALRANPHCLLGVLIAASVMISTRPGLSQQTHRDSDALAHARRARHLDALGPLRSRPLTLEYEYLASWADKLPGTLTVEFVRPDRYSRKEFKPWQTNTRTETYVDSETFRRSFGDEKSMKVSTNPAAEGNLRATVWVDWIGLLQEAPPWAPIVVAEADKSRTGAANHEMFRVQGANLDVYLYFDRTSRLLEKMVQQGTLRGGPPQSALDTSAPSAAPARIETTFAHYRPFKGALFATEITRSFVGGPPSANGMKFVAKLRRVSF